MNYRKVEQYTAERLNRYRNQYPAEIFEGLKIEASSGSFGVCLLTITYENGNPHNLATIESQYVGNYNAIDGKVSDFVIRNYHLILERYYVEHQKEKAKGMSCRLEIFNDSQLVNVLEFTEPEQVKSELVKIVIAEKRRGVRTTYKPKPYSQDIDIVERWTREEAHTTTAIKYVYHFHNLDY